MDRDLGLSSVKSKLLWSVASQQWSVTLKPEECALLLSELDRLEEPTGTVDRRDAVTPITCNYEFYREEDDAQLS